MSEKKTDSKFAQTVAAAKGDPKSEEIVSSNPAGDGSTSMVSKMSQAEALRYMSGLPGMEFAPQNVSLEEGDFVAGFLEGYGAQVEFTNRGSDGKEVVNYVNTWILQKADIETGELKGQRISILSSVQLDKKLAPFIGSFVAICRNRDVRSKSNPAFKVADYTIGGPRPKEGPVRVWASKQAPSARALVAAGALQLPGSDEDAVA